MTTNQQATEAALLKVLADAQVYNENGDQMVDFVRQNSDSRDFTLPLSRWQLEKMIKAAFAAGYSHAVVGQNAMTKNRPGRSAK